MSRGGSNKRKAVQGPSGLQPCRCFLIDKAAAFCRVGVHVTVWMYFFSARTASPKQTAACFQIVMCEGKMN